jgi:hypothetical protein
MQLENLKIHGVNLKILKINLINNNNKLRITNAAKTFKISLYMFIYDIPIKNRIKQLNIISNIIPQFKVKPINNSPKKAT